MPSSSIDTFLASSVMIALVLSTMVSTTEILQPYLGDLSQKTFAERHYHLAKYLLLTTGTPAEWGSSPETVPTRFGLALTDSLHPYELDIDKVTRLNNESASSLTYPQLFASSGVYDVALRIEINTVFDLSTTLVSTLEDENETIYDFELCAERAGLPISAQLKCYIIIRDYIQNLTSSTSSTGTGSLQVSIPNSNNGTALLVAFAEIQPEIVTFNVHKFGHKSSTPEPDGTFMRLNPLDYMLAASLLYPDEEVLKAQIFTFNYSFNLTQVSGSNQTAEFEIPQLIDSSPMILVIAGFNGSSSFAEWVSYPQVPLEIGADLGESDVLSFPYIVSINNVLYDLTIESGGMIIDNIQKRTD